MTEEIVPKGTESTQEQVVEEKTFSAAEQEALEQGWVPKEEFQGDDSKWVEAGEFVRRGELFKKIEHQNREIKEVRKALAGFKEHYTKVKETEYIRALASLKSEYKTANREGDFDKADKLESEIESVEKEAAVVRQQVAEVATAQEIHPEFAAWVQKNDWYATQPHMKTFADYKGNEYARLGLNSAEVLKKVSEEVRKEFPTKFSNPNRERPSAVEGATQQRGAARKGDIELNDQERKVMNSFVSSGLMTKEEYLVDLKKIKGVA
jgi:hypothetical protein